MELAIGAITAIEVVMIITAVIIGIATTEGTAPSDVSTSASFECGTVETD